MDQRATNEDKIHSEYVNEMNSRQPIKAWQHNKLPAINSTVVTPETCDYRHSNWHMLTRTEMRRHLLLNGKPGIKVPAIKSLTVVKEEKGKGEDIPLHFSKTSSANDSFIKQDSVNKQHDKRMAKDNTKRIYPLKSSLFYNVPPYLHFHTDIDEMMKLPREIRRTLRWNLSSITPSLIVRIVRCSGFRITQDETSWVSTWGKHLKSDKFMELGENQKFNHFPGSFHLGRKDRLWINISKMQKIYGKEEFSLMPQTYVLPREMQELQVAWSETGYSNRWILKPPASARGLGVTVTSQWDDVPKTQSLVVQRYISQPYLINGTKFDLRLYVLVTSFDPLRTYVYEDGLVRFASEKYSSCVNSLSEKFVHLTNYSINRSNSNYTVNDDENLPQGHKWTLKCFWAYFRANGINDRRIWSSLLDVIIKALISCEDPVSRLIKTYSKNRYCSYELFGFDIMLDHALKPWLLEVNISPSLHTKSQLDLKVKSELVKDMLNTVGFHIPEAELSTKKYNQVMKRAKVRSQSGIFWNRYMYCFAVSPEGRRKQDEFEQGKLNETSFLDNLTPDDIRLLVQSEDELARCGAFERVFPSDTSSSYLKYFQQPKYYNYLLNAWENKYRLKRKAGISFLQPYCKKMIHLQSVVCNNSDDNRLLLDNPCKCSTHLASDYDSLLSDSHHISATKLYKNKLTSDRSIFPPIFLGSKTKTGGSKNRPYSSLLQ